MLASPEACTDPPRKVCVKYFRNVHDHGTLNGLVTHANLNYLSPTPFYSIGRKIAAMKWASATSSDPGLPTALEQATADVEAALGARPDLALVFISESHKRSYAMAAAILADRLGDCCIVGCSASGVIGGGHEWERMPAVSITGAMLPGVELTARWLGAAELPAPADSPLRWQHMLGVTPPQAPAFLILADPYSFPVEAFLGGLDRVYPDCVKLGGLASGMQAPGEAALYLEHETHRAGAVCLALTGDIELQTLVAQGCRPIGEPLFITRCDGTRLLEIDGQRPLDVLKLLYERLPAGDRALMSHSLFLGIAMRPSGTEYRQGDFLIRNLMGEDNDDGGLLVSADLRENHVVQFHLRDADTAAYDLERVLSNLDATPAPGSGALLFSCTGRGENLYGVRDHDVNAFRHHVGDLPLGGFFCNGEIGPVGGTTFVHGYTSAFGIAQPRNG